MASLPPSLLPLAHHLMMHGPHKQEPTPRRIRALFDSVFLFDTILAQHVWEHQYYPQLYVPATEFKHGVLQKGELVEEGGKQSVFGAVVKSNRETGQDHKARETSKVLWFEGGVLSGLVRVDFGDIDQWFEEDQPIYVHPKDPYKRIDILPSSREIAVKVDGVIIAKSGSSNMFLFETLLRPRYYLPKTSVQWQYLTPSSTTSKCPYKGTASYYDVTVHGIKHDDLIWWYPHTTLESTPIAGLICFYNEKVDIWIDGVQEKR